MSSFLGRQFYHSTLYFALKEIDLVSHPACGQGLGTYIFIYSIELFILRIIKESTA